jgi:hypothetical protein
VAAIAGNEPHPPLFYLLAKSWQLLAGESEVAFRLLPLAFSVLAVPLGGRVAHHLAGPASGLLTALLLAVHPWQIWHAQDARMYSQAATLGLATILAALRLDEQPTNGRRWLGFTVVALLAALSHYTVLPLLALVSGVWLLRHRLSRRWLASQAVLWGASGGWLVVNAPLLGRYSGNGDQPSFLEAVRRAAVAFASGRSGAPEWATLAGLVGLLLGLLGAIVLVRRAGLPALLVVGVVPLTVILEWAASLRGPLFNESYLLVAGGPAMVMIASGIARLGRWLGPPVLAGCLAVALLALNNYWFDPTYAKAADWRSEASAVTQGARPTDLVILNYPDPTFEFYYRGTAPVRLLPASVPFRREALSRELAELTARYERVWLVPVRAANWDSDGFVERWLDVHTRLVATASWTQVRLVLYETARGVLARARPLAATFDHILLHAAALEPASCPAPCTLTLQLIWSARQPVATSYKVFVHALDEQGSLVAQSDAVPADWQRPTTSWHPDELVLDAHTLVLPYSGRYQVIAGLYQEQHGRLLTTTGQDAVAVGEVSVR